MSDFVHDAFANTQKLKRLVYYIVDAAHNPPPDALEQIQAFAYECQPVCEELSRQILDMSGSPHE